MILENAPNNIIIAGGVKNGCVFRYLNKFYMAIQGSEDKAINLENGEIIKIDPVVSVEIFPNVKAVF